MDHMDLQRIFAAELYADIVAIGGSVSPLPPMLAQEELPDFIPLDVLLELYNGISPDHGMEHIRRDHQMACAMVQSGLLRLDREEGFALRGSALLHDIGLSKVEHNQNHAHVSSQMISQLFNDDRLTIPLGCDPIYFRNQLNAAVYEHSDYTPDGQVPCKLDIEVHTLRQLY